MKSWATRFSALTLLVVLAALLAAAAAPQRGPVKQPNKLVILSTTDVKGRTNPCG
jgi:hypothetical protein